MTFADVARRVGLNTTSVTYYFKRKEDLAVACFEHTLERLAEMLDEAAAEPVPELRVRRFLHVNMARLARIRRGEERDFAVLSDLRAMEGPVKQRLLDGWRGIFRKTRSLWGSDGTRAETDLRGGARACAAREHLLAARLAGPLRDRRISPRRGAADGGVPPRRRRPARGLGAPAARLAARRARAGARGLPARGDAADQRARLSRRLGAAHRLRAQRHQGQLLPSPRCQGRSRDRLLQAQLRHHRRRPAPRRGAGRIALAAAGEHAGDAARRAILRARAAAAHHPRCRACRRACARR